MEGRCQSLCDKYGKINTQSKFNVTFGSGTISENLVDGQIKNDKKRYADDQMIVSETCTLMLVL